MLYNTHLNNFIVDSEKYLPNLIHLPKVHDLNHLLISSCPLILDCALTRFLKEIVCEGNSHLTTKRILSDKLFVEYNPQYLMFNMESIHFQEFVSYIKNIMCNNHVMMHRSHILVLKDVHTLSNAQQHSIIKIFEPKTHVRLIATASVSVSSRMADHFGYIRVPPPTQKELLKAFEGYCVEQTIEDREHTLSYCGYDIRRALMSLCFPPEMIRDSPLFDALEREIHVLLEAVRKTVQCSKVIVLTRQSIYKIMKYNIPHSQICKTILKVVLQKHKKKQSLIVRMTQIITETEHKLLQSSKPIFYYELLVLRYTQLCALQILG